jgi:hypothetical protein
VSLGAVPQIVLIPDVPLDDLGRIAALIERAEPRVRRRFLALIEGSAGLADLDRITGLLEVGRVNEALAFSEGVGEGLSNALESAYAAAGLSAAEVLRSQADTLFDFNSLNRRSVATLERNRLRLVREFNTEQRVATRVLLQDAVTRGLPPIKQARIIRGSIGLTGKQARAVTNFRSMLASTNPIRTREALTRALRDKRFDRTIARAARGELVLSAEQIDRMVARYQENYIRYRANTIARTETVAAIHAGDEELWRQAIVSGEVPADQVISTWHIANRNVRSSHRAMNGQTRPFGEPFRSGDGNNLRFPGDPLGPAADTINCQCVVARSLKKPIRRPPGVPMAIAAG